MRLVEVVRLLAPVAMAFGLAVGVARRRLLRDFIRADATAPERAILLETANPLRRFHARRLVHAGVLEEAPGGRLWLQRQALVAYRQGLRTRALVAVGLVLAVCALMIYVSR